MLLALCLQGCMTAQTVFDPQEEDLPHGFIYSGVRKDFRCAFGNELSVHAAPIWPVLIVDMPLSLAGDTIVLPYTLSKTNRVSRHSQPQSGDVPAQPR
jgi:uncharacterized protein YceK